jgi:HD domain-containing protein
VVPGGRGSPAKRPGDMVQAWRSRPSIAAATRLAALGGPVEVSLAAVWVVGRAVGPPSGSLVVHVGWWAALSGVATVSLVGAARLSRRLLPLAALMRLSLVFPDAAPSRFGLALRTGTVATLETRLAAMRDGSRERTPAEAAALLLELVRDLDEHDALTRGHSERVRAYAQSLGRELGLDAHSLDLLNWAALLHDVGKLEVPHEILAKSGRPTVEEWEILRRHPAAGAVLATPLRTWLGDWSAAIDQHHERWDGTGYPRGLAGEEIALAGRIVAVADVFDVITSTRSYKQSGSVAAARQELARCAGTQFDPEVVRAFLAISVRQSRLAAPLAWLAHAAVLFRLPLAPANGLSVGAAAAVAVGAGIGSGALAHASEQVSKPKPAPHVRVVAPQRIRPPAAVTTPAPLPRPSTTRKRKAAPDTHPAATPKPRAIPSESPAQTAQPSPPEQPTIDTAAPKPDDARNAPPKPSPAPHTAVVQPAPELEPVDLGPPSVLPLPVETVTTVTAPLTEQVSAVVEVVNDVTAPPPAAPPPPVSPPSSESPPAAESPPEVSGGLLDGVLSLVTGLLPLRR